MPLNHAFNEDLISVDTQTGVTWNLGGSTFKVAGPTKANLDELRDEWVKWIEENLDDFATGDKQAMANADKSVPNLSSIVLMGTTPDGDILLTGDARGDHIIAGLEKSGVVQAGAGHHFRLLKLQHHGSIRNVARDYFERLTADIYVISADGKYGNPDPGTLTLLVDVAHDQGRSPLLVLTNEPESVQKLKADRPPGQFGYTLAVRDPAKSAIVVDLAAGTAV
jgi:hypothetical protein